MFSDAEFIEASRQFVCVRLETYENKEHEALIRQLLNGRYANTAFTVFAPDGERQMTRTSRSASSVLGAEGRGPGAKAESNADVIAAMNEIAAGFPAKGDASGAILQDFHSFRQALNVASGDQRLLVFVVPKPGQEEATAATLRPVFSDPEVIGRFHLDQYSAGSDESWTDAIEGADARPGIHVIHADTFGQSGRLVASLAPNATGDTVKAALLKANAEFAGAEERKVYSDHVQEGRRKGIQFETEIPFGEDRDGDGEIDKPERGSKGKAKSKDSGKGSKGKADRE